MSFLSGYQHTLDCLCMHTDMYHRPSLQCIQLHHHIHRTLHSCTHARLWSLPVSPQCHHAHRILLFQHCLCLCSHQSHRSHRQSRASWHIRHHQWTDSQLTPRSCQELTRSRLTNIQSQCNHIATPSHPSLHMSHLGLDLHILLPSIRSLSTHSTLIVALARPSAQPLFRQYHRSVIASPSPHPSLIRLACRSTDHRLRFTALIGHHRRWLIATQPNLSVRRANDRQTQQLDPSHRFRSRHYRR
jgi:hypothetical protein